MSLSTRTILSNLARPQISPVLIDALITLLQELEPENIKLLGQQQLRNLQSNTFNKKIVNNFTDLGSSPLSVLPGFSAAIKKFRDFKSSLPEAMQTQLDDTRIQLPTFLGYTRIEKFSDICFSESPKRTPEQACLFTSQIFLWQLVINTGIEELQDILVPDVIRLLAKVWLYDIKPLTHIETVNDNNDRKLQSRAILIPNVSYSGQLLLLQTRHGDDKKTIPCDGGQVMLFNNKQRSIKLKTVTKKTLEPVIEEGEGQVMLFTKNKQRSTKLKKVTKVTLAPVTELEENEREISCRA
ncbi:MAG: hypothetical protein V4501_02120 [Pseudomonadota bacterium]